MDWSLSATAALVIAALVVLVATGAVVAWHSVVVMPYDLRVTEFDAALPGLGAELDGYAIVVVADLHHRPIDGDAYLRRVAGVVNGLAPDLVALLGDYGISYKYAPRLSKWLYRRLFPGVERFVAALVARDGIVAVLGNHDHYGGAAFTRARLTAAGVRVLVNERIVLARGRARLYLGGVDDAEEGRVDPRGGVGDAPPDEPRLLLSHHPDGVLALDRCARLDLVLSGHTHGGQVVLPLLGAPITMSRVCDRRHPSGWVPNDVAPLYVSRGVGCQTPLRFRCPPEVLLVRLRAAPRDAGAASGAAGGPAQQST
ncbi:MAG TPA: metallophosphoesterase [Gemmatimonadaceae bacterium]|nr:metallophosphoesterase [Gemmatimonadaceae bacterium]